LKARSGDLLGERVLSAFRTGLERRIAHFLERVFLKAA
jgi:hypothetical protein